MEIQWKLDKNVQINHVLLPKAFEENILCKNDFKLKAHFCCVSIWREVP